MRGCGRGGRAGGYWGVQVRSGETESPRDGAGAGDVNVLDATKLCT